MCDEDASACLPGTAVCSDNEVCDAVDDECLAMDECDGCLIDGLCIGDGFLHPFNACLICDSESAADSWSDNLGATCDDRLFCTVDDTCQEGGTCVGATPRDCGDNISCNGDEVCDEDTSACLPGAVQCSDDEICDAVDDECVAMAECDGCLIDGLCVPNGFLHPFNTCQICDAGSAADGWSDNVGATCDDRLFCTVDDTCQEGGTCVGATPRDCGDNLSCNGDEECDEDTSACLPGTVQCGDDEICDAVNDQCVTLALCTGCLIDAVCYDYGQASLSDGCQYCEPSLTSTDWSAHDTTAVPSCSATGVPIEVVECSGATQALPQTDWTCLRDGSASVFVLIGPGVDLRFTDLSRTDLAGLHAPSISTCPQSMPDQWACVLAGDGVTYALAGPEANLSGADLSGADLSGVNLSGANLSNADLSGAEVSDANLSDVDLSGAVLTNIHLTGLEGTCPSRLPDDWVCLAAGLLSGTVLFGATVDLSQANLSWIDLSNADLSEANLSEAVLVSADLSGADLSNANLDKVAASDLVGCPSALPDHWICVAEGSGQYALLGRTAFLVGASLVGLDLTGVDLSEANLEGVTGTNLEGCPSALPEEWTCMLDGSGSSYVLVGPTAKLVGTNLSGLDLSEVVLDGAQPQELIEGCPVALPDEWVCMLDGSGDTFVLLGPAVSLYEPNLSGLNLSGLNLSGARLDTAELSGANLSGANLAGAYLAVSDMIETDLSGTDLTGANLRASTFQLVDMEGASLLDANLSGANMTYSLATQLTGGCPSVPPDEWVCMLDGSGSTYVMVGPTAIIFGANLAGLDLSDVDVRYLRALELTACPSALPADWTCMLDGGGSTYVMVGPTADLFGSNLSGLDLSDAVLDESYAAELVEGCPSGLPDEWICLLDGSGATYVLLGPTARVGWTNLSGLDLSDLNLTGASLVNADLTNAVLNNLRAVDLVHGCPSALPEPWFCGTHGGAYHLLGPTANLAGLNLTRSVLSGKDLSGVNFTDANLTSVDLSGADLSGADLSGADLSFAILSGATLSGAVVSGVTWSYTRCPDGTKSEDNGYTCEGHL